MSKRVVISESGSVGFIKDSPKVGVKIEFHGKNNKPDPIREEIKVSADKERWEYWQKNPRNKSVMREIRKYRTK